MFQSSNSINRGIHHSRTHDPFHQTSYIALPPKILRSPLAMEHWKGNRPPSFAVPRRPQRLKVAVKQRSPICSNAFSPGGGAKAVWKWFITELFPVKSKGIATYIITFKLASSTMPLSSNAWLMQVEEVCPQLLPLAFACETRLPKQSLECPHQCERESRLFACFSAKLA